MSGRIQQVSPELLATPTAKVDQSDDSFCSSSFLYIRLSIWWTGQEANQIRLSDLSEPIFYGQEYFWLHPALAVIEPANQQLYFVLDHLIEKLSLIYLKLTWDDKNDDNTRQNSIP